MHSVAKKSVAIASAFGVAGISSLFFGAAPASADPACADGGTLLTTANICELTYTTANETQTFAVQPGMTQLQVLIVGGGGDGGYGGGGGGGGSVKIVDFDGTTATSLSVLVGGYSSDSSISDGTTTVVANTGQPADEDGTTTTSSGKTKNVPAHSGESGNGHKGYPEGSKAYGGGGGADGSPTHRRDGGAGKVADKVTYKTPKGKTITPVYKLFAGDTNCYGGGGAVGDGTTDGTPGCNAGYVAAGGAVVDPAANSGSGSGGFIEAQNADGNQAASGVVVIRWNATPDVSVSFSDGKRGHDPKTEHLFQGDLATQPANPKVSGYSFVGWYVSNEQFSPPVNFNAPVEESTTYYGVFKKK
jgi:uncharacterized repeat protein (TIGR02543 family)